MHGIINVYKSAGKSSNAVLSFLKKSCDIKKLGHLGTLDPLASGVLPVLVGKGTKLFDFYLNKTKIYRAVFTFGKETDTLDSEGQVVKMSNYIPSKQEIENTCKKLEGNILQIPPNFSAKSINGERAYNLARRGETVNLAPKNVIVEYFKLIRQINKTSFLFEIKCSSGTYIRSLARDLGNLTNSCAFMGALIRINSGEFNILKSNYYKDLTKDNFVDKIIKLETLLENFERINLDSKYFKQISNGVKIPVSHSDCDNIVVYCSNQLIGLAKIDKGILQIKTNLQN